MGTTIITKIATIPVGFGPEHWGLLWIRNANGENVPELVCEDPTRPQAPGDKPAATRQQAQLWAESRALLIRIREIPAPRPVEPTPSGLQYIVPGCEKVHSSRSGKTGRTLVSSQMDLF